MNGASLLVILEKGIVVSFHLSPMSHRKSLPRDAESKLTTQQSQHEIIRKLEDWQIAESFSN
jgi:hypothetical protein